MSTSDLLEDLDPDRELNGKRKVPTHLLHRLVSKGMSNSEIVAWVKEYLGVDYTGSAVYYFRRTHGYPIKTPRSEALALIPWRVRKEHGRDPLYEYLVLAARERAGGKLSVRQLSYLSMHKNKLAYIGMDAAKATDGYKELDRDAKIELAHALTPVVHYDADHGGFQLVTRRPSIDNDLIREPSLEDDGSPKKDWTARSVSLPRMAVQQ